ncbi:MAG TPA: helix-turn-helix transcriptional regulator [Clostridiales bacterium]|nr:helix-turn-helix transcriptional regulator [Clostridiales bacterium]
MPFKKINVKDEINKRLENNIELKQAYDNAQHEYEVVKQIVKMRNEMGLSQSDVARQSGLTQQMVSRIETVDNSPTLRNFIRYVDSLGLEIKIEKKNSETGRYCAPYESQ